MQARVTAQDRSLPVWDLQEADLTNALRLKAFRGELDGEAADRLVALFGERRSRCRCFVPDIDRDRRGTGFRDLSRRRPRTGCRTMDILHVAYARQVGAQCSVSYDERQRAPATISGLAVLPDSLPA